VEPADPFVSFICEPQIGRRSLVSMVVCIIFFCCCGEVYGVNPAVHITQYGHTVWRIGQDGLDATPLSIAQTADGYIWIGTSNGLLRFDGVRFTPWASQGGEQLKGTNVLNLLGTHDGSLYVGTLQELARITNGRVYNYRSSIYKPGPFVEDAEASIWMTDYLNFTAANTLCRLGPETMACLGTKDGLKCLDGSALLSDHRGSLWLGSREGICHWQQTIGPEFYPTGGVLALGRTRDGALWAGTGTTGEGHGLLRFSEGKWRSFVTRDVDGTKLPAATLLADSHSSLWIGTKSQGLYRLQAGQLERFDTADGLSSNNIRRILEDREGDIWVVTDRGVDMFRDLPVTSYAMREGMPYANPYGITAQEDGTIWIGTKGGGLVRFRNNVFSTVTPTNGQPYSCTLFSDSQNQLWISDCTQRLYLYKDGRFQAVKDNGNPDLGWVGSIVEDREHHVWASTQNTTTGKVSLLMIEGLHVATRIAESYVPTGGETASFLAADPHGGLWVEESQHGIFHLLDGTFERTNIGGYKSLILMMIADPDGALWVVPAEEGVVRYSNGKAQYLTKENGLPCNTGMAVINDHAGSHWIYMSCGIVKIADSELAAWWQNPKYQVHTTVFNVLDGAEPRMSGNFPVMTSDGRIWSENQSYLQVLDTQHLPHNQMIPPVQVDRLLVDHKRYDVNEATRLPPNPREVEIDYSALSYVVPERVKFRYQLGGYDTRWVDAGTRRQAFYNDLKPGHYTFHVIACNNDGVWNLSGIRTDFTIPPAWYQTVWFKLLCFVLVALFAYAFYQSRLTRYAALLKLKFDERIEERTRLARDLHDTLLQTIQGSKLVADHALEEPTDAVRMHKALDLVAQWLERASLEGRAALNSLRSSSVDTNDLAAAFRDAAEKCRIGSNIRVEFVLNGKSNDMHPIVRDEIYRIGYEAINNACAHSGGSVLKIELTYSNDVHLSVRDDGRGIKEEIVRLGREGHFGLKGMRERADRIGARLSLKTEANGGTDLTLLVPGSVIFKTYKPQKQSKGTNLFSGGHS
jgi:signal transduction histidine kinase/ligand-binding sensor domain-containing protein